MFTSSQLFHIQSSFCWTVSNGKARNNFTSLLTPIDIPIRVHYVTFHYITMTICPLALNSSPQSAKNYYLYYTFYKPNITYTMIVEIGLFGWSGEMSSKAWSNFLNSFFKAELLANYFYLSAISIGTGEVILYPDEHLFNGQLLKQTSRPANSILNSLYKSAWLSLFNYSSVQLQIIE